MRSRSHEGARKIQSAETRCGEPVIKFATVNQVRASRSMPEPRTTVAAKEAARWYERDQQRVGERRGRERAERWEAKCLLSKRDGRAHRSIKSDKQTDRTGEEATLEPFDWR